MAYQIREGENGGNLSHMFHLGDEAFLFLYVHQKILYSMETFQCVIFTVVRNGMVSQEEYNNHQINMNMQGEIYTVARPSRNFLHQSSHCGSPLKL